MKSYRESKFFYYFPFVLQTITPIVWFFDIIFVKQIVGFLYLTFVPGMIFLNLLETYELDLVKSILFSVGLSIAFLMFIGFLANDLYFSLGILDPLHPKYLMTTIFLVLILLCLVAFFKSKISTTTFYRKSVPNNVAWSMPSVCLPLLSVLGALLVNSSKNNSILLFMIFFISIFVFASAFFGKSRFSELYSIIIYMIGLSVLLEFNLMTDYIFGWDQPAEYYCFKFTKINSHWNPRGTSLADLDVSKNLDMLSVTILPVVYSQMLNLEGTWVFKIVYPILSSFVALALYSLYGIKTEKNAAFLATFFFITVSVGLGWGPYKQSLAQLFYVLLYIVLFDRNLPSKSRSILFVVFSFALVVSHYSISYILLFVISLTWIFSKLRKAYSIIPLDFVLVFFVMCFSWYIYMSKAPSYALANSSRHVYESFFQDFFNPNARGGRVLQGLGLERPPTIVHQISRFFFWLTEFFIVIGFIKLLKKRKERNFDHDYFFVILLNMMILAMNVILPGLSSTLGTERFYQTALIILAPLCISGIELDTKRRFSKNVAAEKKSLGIPLTLSILLPLFLFQSGFIYEITGAESWCIPLSGHRMSEILLYERITNTPEVLGAEWLSNNINTTDALVYADSRAKFCVLTSYGVISREQIMILTNSTSFASSNEFVYLRRINTIGGVMIRRDLTLWNITEISSVLNDQNRIYSNGNSQIYGVKG